MAQYIYLSNGQTKIIPGTKGGLRSRVAVVDHFIVYQKETALNVWIDCGGHGDPDNEIVTGGQCRMGVRGGNWCIDIEKQLGGFVTNTENTSWKNVYEINRYDYPYTEIYSRFPTQPEMSIASAQNTLAKNLYDGGVWDKLDGLIVINKTEGQSVLNWIKDNHNLVKYLSTEFTSLFGFKGHSADGSYMDMDFNPKNDGVTFTNAQAHIGCYVNTEVEEDHTFLFGNSSGGTLAEPATGMIWRTGSWQGKINNGDGSYGEFYMPGRNLGYITWVRNADNKITGYFNGYPQTVSAALITGTDLLDDVMYVFKNANTGLNKSDNGLAVMHYGGALTDADVSLLYSEINTYLTTIGANESFGTAKLVDLDFESDTYLSKGFWNVLSGAPNFQYAVNPISGTKSALFASGDRAHIYYPVYSGNVSIKFAIKFTDASPGSNVDYLYFRTGTTTIGYLRLYTTGRTLLTQGASTSYGNTVKADGQVYWMWLEYTKGTGANAVVRLYLNTVDTKPANPECSITNGNGTVNCNNLVLYGGTEFVIDNILITPL